MYVIRISEQRRAGFRMELINENPANPDVATILFSTQLPKDVDIRLEIQVGGYTHTMGVK